MNDLQTAFEDFVKARRGRGLIVATVQSVDTEDFIFDCTDAEGNAYQDVRINAVPGVVGLMAIPAVSSTVIITDLGNQDQDFVLIQAGAIQSLRIHADTDTEILIDDSTIRLGNNRISPAVLGDYLNNNLTTLLDELEDLLNALSTFTTSQAAAATGTLAPLAPAYGVLNAAVTATSAALQLIDLNNHLSNIVTVSH